MKIECTKKEWGFILTQICAYNNQTTYKHPDAKCIIFDANEDIIISIDVTFVEDNE